MGWFSKKSSNDKPAETARKSTQDYVNEPSKKNEDRMIADLKRLRDSETKRRGE